MLIRKLPFNKDRAVIKALYKEKIQRSLFFNEFFLKLFILDLRIRELKS